MVEAQYTIVLKQPPTNTEALHTAANVMTTLNPKDRRYQERRSFARDFGYWDTNVHQFLDSIGISRDKAEINEASGVVVINVDTNKFESIFPWDGEGYVIPPHLRDIVQSVHGPRQTIRFRHHYKLHDTLVPNTSVYANQLSTYYGMPTGVTGKGQTIGIIELGGGFSQADLIAYWAKAGVNFTGTVTAMSVDGTKNQPGVDVDADGEVALDIQIASSIAPASNIVVYFVANTEAGFIQAINAAVHDATYHPDIISISWGGPENSWSAGGRTSLSGACQAAALLGVTILVASGDDGSGDGERGINCDFPASSPWVLACGGTSLTQATAETAWTPHSGGGVSSYFPLPQWQAFANIPKTPNLSPVTGFAGRGVPDVAANGDPASGYTIQVDGRLYPGFGGTSCVAPLLSGEIALCNEANKKNVGFVNSLLYAAPTTLKDITFGNNGFYTCAPGWDAVTGLGTPTGSFVNVLGGGTTGGVGIVTVKNVAQTTSQNTSLMFTLTASTTATGATIQTWNLNDPANGAVSGGATSQANSIAVTYVPKLNYTGTDSFTYSATDSAGNKSNTATVTITVTTGTTTGGATRTQLRNTMQVGPNPTVWNILYDSNPNGL